MLVRTAAPSRNLADDSTATNPDPVWRHLRLMALVGIGLQLALSLSISALLYHRFHLLEDFGIFNQAWSRIGGGDLNPYNSIYGFYFYKSHFELIMWPLGLLHVVLRQPFVLLAVQDVTASAVGVVAFSWVLEFLRIREVPIKLAKTAATVTLLLILANPLYWGTVTFDFHFESTAVLLAVLAARCMWRGQSRQSWIWVVLLLLCGDVAGLYVVGLGVSALLAGKAIRRQGAILMGVGIVWLWTIDSIGANLGSSLNDYAYLAGRSTLPSKGGLALVALGVVTHPGRVIDVIQGRLSELWGNLWPAGAIGLASPWGFGVPIVVLASSILNSSSTYIGSAFQNFPVFPFVLFGSVTVVVSLYLRCSSRFRGLIAAATAIVVSVTLVTGISSSANVALRAIETGPTAAQAAVLRSVLSKTPSGSEVVSSVRVVGRFADRRWIFILLPSTRTIPVNTRNLVFVVAVTNGVESTSQSQASIVEAALRDHYHARVLADSHGIYAFQLQAPPGLSEIDVAGANTKT